ncbi:MAG: threonine/serine exporter family protein [Luteococcus sp.]|uniref:threonine/serine ThrE exporter family protein n=1 Tax=Luteococcus sp. TaxID=1969402 RepID=UPI0026495824|nr:threonine/serine exporter family protein [Luteococcus sp.]MDN5562691.1 threonine/serine exporter family protein [Luteococcus sp.]
MSESAASQGRGPASNAAETARDEMDLLPDVDVAAGRARAITELAVRVGELALSSGSSAARTESLVRRVAHAYGLPVQLDVTYSRILLSYEPLGAATPITIMRSVASNQTDYDRLERVEGLVTLVRHGEVDEETATARLNHIVAAPFSHPRWFTRLAACLLGATIALLIGGNGADMAVGAVSTLLVDEARRRLERWSLGSFFTTAVCAAIPTTLAVLALAVQHWAPTWLPRIDPSLVIAAGMVSLLAGMGTVAAAGDAIDGSFLGAGARTMEVVVTTGGIVLGLVTTLWLGRALGVTTQLEPTASQTPNHLLQLACSGLVALCFGVRFMMRAKALATTTVLGVLLWTSYLAAAWVTGSHPARVAIAALAVGFVARLLVHRLHIPLVALTSTAVAALMPGVMLYRGVFAITDEAPVDATWLLLGATYVAVGLAAGTSFGAMLAALLLYRRRDVDTTERFALVEQAHG